MLDMIVLNFFVWNKLVLVLLDCLFFWVLFFFLEFCEFEFWVVFDFDVNDLFLILKIEDVFVFFGVGFDWDDFFRFIVL